MTNPTKVVPVEPTEEMLDAGMKYLTSPRIGGESIRVELYKAMLSAAPPASILGFEEWWQASLKDQTMRTVKESYRAAWQAALTAHNQRWLDLADELKREANEVPYDSAETTQVIFRIESEIRQILEQESE